MDSKNNHSLNSCYRLLAICARAEAHSKMDEQLTLCLKEFTSWADLPAQAELHGMSLLLWHHLLQRLNFPIPPETKRTLNGLYLRHRANYQQHVQVLLEITALFENSGIRAIVLKGLALAHEYYPDPVLRPASDIDLLLKTEDILPAIDVFTQAGYKSSSTLQMDLKQLPKELTVSSPVKNGLSTRIELHHYDPQVKSVVDNSPDDEFFGFNAPPHTIKIDNQKFYVPDPLNHLDYLIRHLTRHMFVAIDEKPLLLKWVADIICLVEHHASEIDWTKYPALIKRLEVLYSFIPFPERLSKVIPIQKIQVPTGVNQYPQGWPQYAFPAWKRIGIWQYLKHTFAPPSNWWLQLQYGVSKKDVFWYGQIVYRLQVIKIALSKLMKDKK